MKNFRLSTDRLTALRAAHKLAKITSSRNAYKINAIILLGQKWTLEEVSNALLLDTETLRGYITRYKKGGLKFLVKNNYEGKLSFLNKSNQKKLIKHLEKNLYRRTSEIITYINKEFSVKYSPSGLKKILHKLGFTYKKPKLVPAKLDEQSQDEFIECYTKFMKNKSEKDAVLFYDSSHPQFSTIADYGWIKKGQEKFIKNNVGRKRLNISGAVDIETLDTVINFPEKVNAATTIETFKKIEAAYPKSNSINIILDNAASHKAKIVEEYLEKSKINLVYLPPYSPNLNPIERLWRMLRDEVLSNTFYESYGDFKKSCKGFFKKILHKKDKLNNLITANFQELSLDTT